MSNPFITQPHRPPLAEEAVEPDPLLGRHLVVVGPPVPPGTATRPADPVLARRRVDWDALLWVVGVHGGSGATSVAGALGEHVCESRGAWPVSRPLEPQVLLVARTHATGLAAAENALQEWGSGTVAEVRLLGVLLVDDAPQLPRQLLPAMGRVLHSAPRGWHLRWQESWRVYADGERPLTYTARRTLGDIRQSALVEGAKPGDNPLLTSQTTQPADRPRWRRSRTR